MKYSTLSLLVFSVLLVSGCNFTLAADVTPPPGYQEQPIAASTPVTTASPHYPIVPPDPAEGKVIFQEKCAPCHGETGLGDGIRSQDLPNPVTAIGSAETARAALPSGWFGVLTEGNIERFMPPFPSLNERQKWDVIAYALSLSKSPQSLEQAAKLYEENCLECHGERGRGDGVKSAQLTMPDFTQQEFMAGKSENDFFQSISEGGSTGMPAFGEKLSENERWNLSGYVRSLSFASQNLETPAATQASVRILPTPSLEDLPITATVASTETFGSIQGSVTNASGVALPSGLDVLLHAFDQMQLVMTATTTLESDGSYNFDNVELIPGRTFFSTIDYGGVLYGSEFAAVEDPSVPLVLPIEVYDSTTDPSILTVDRLHYFFEFLDDQNVRVAELYIISNPTTKTLIASEEGQPIVKFSLPAGAVDLEFQDGTIGDRYVKTDEGFGDTTPVRPGEGTYQVLFSYTMPFDRKLELNHQMSMDTNAIVILVPEDGIKVKGDGIEDGGTREVQGAPYHMYNGDGYKQGEELKLTISGRPSGTNLMAASGSNQNLFIGIGVLGIVLIIAGIWMFQRNRRVENPTPSPIPTLDIEYENAESVMDAILALDDLYQEGQLPEEAYLKRRSELKERLKQINDPQG